jgi:drug/metabolite transporter (DMT)-like permease
MTKQHKALISVSACVLFWGFSFISIKIAIVFFPPMTLGAIRFALAVIFLFFLKKKYAPGEKLKTHDIPLLAGAGLTGATLYFFFENNGVALIPASEASIIVGSIPVITLIAESVRNKIISMRKREVSDADARKDTAASDEKSAVKNSVFRRVILPGLGALVSLSGVALVAGVSLMFTGTMKGYFFMAGACVSWVAYCFLTRPLFVRCSRIYIVFWQSVFGLIGFLPFAFMEGVLREGVLHAPGLYVWGHVLFLGICCSALCYTLYAQALQTLGVGTSSLFINLIPVVSAIGGFFVLGERLRPLQWFGAALVLAGVYLAMPPAGDKRKK